MGRQPPGRIGRARALGPHTRRLYVHNTDLGALWAAGLSGKPYGKPGSNVLLALDLNGPA